MRFALWIVRALLAPAASLCLVAAVSAQALSTPVARVDARRPASVRVPRPHGNAAASRPTSIQGTAWQSNNAPAPKAMLRLRNVLTGKVEATAVASDAGDFAFTGVPAGTYLIEMISEKGKVLMVGQTFTVAPGETIATFVRLAPKVPWFTGFFDNAARTISLGAAAAGVTAIAPSRATPVSASR